jgi:hypothetical protein
VGQGISDSVLRVVGSFLPEPRTLETTQKRKKVLRPNLTVNAGLKQLHNGEMGKTREPVRP